jgi:hypothetical protein
MKRTNFTVGLVLVASLGFYSCDKIENPIPVTVGGLDWSLSPFEDSASYTWPTWSANTNTERNVLIEDFTGHTCVGCPAAADEAAAIEAANPPGRVIIASIHASTTNGYQVPQPAPSSFTTDFRTDAGNEYATTFGCDLNPLGTVNRTLGTYPPTNPILQLHTSWAANTSTLLATNLDVNVQVEYNYFPNEHGLFVHTESDFINSKSGTYNVVVYLVRDTVIAPQKLPGGLEEEEYHHHNVLTANINGTWGTELFNGSAAAGDKFYNDYAFEVPTTDTTYDIDNLSIITYVFNRNTYEVLQAVITHLQ